MNILGGNAEKNGRDSVKQDVVRVLPGTVAVLTVPLLGMQFSEGVNWSPADFAVIAVLLITTGLIYVALARQLNKAWTRAVLGAGLTLAVLLIWAELAVGLVGTPFAGS